MNSCRQKKKMKRFFNIIVIIIYFLPAPGDSLMAKQTDILVGAFEEWKLGEKTEYYTGEGIFEYMDGAGEIYRLFHYKSMTVGRYSADALPDITAEVFDMGTSENAYGVFTHSNTGEQVTVGQGGFFRTGLLCFWKDRYSICLTCKNLEKSQFIGLGQAIAENIKNTGDLPELVSHLPQEHLRRETIRYFHRKDSLNYHYFIAVENILLLNDDTDAVLAEYETGEKTMTLLLVNYGKTSLAEKAFTSFVKTYMPDSEESGIVQVEDGSWTAAKRHNTYIILVFEVPTRKLAETMRSKVIQNLKEKHHEKK